MSQHHPVLTADALGVQGAELVVEHMKQQKREALDRLALSGAIVESQDWRRSRHGSLRYAICGFILGALCITAWSALAYFVFS